jgi:hypothetical protein
MLRTPCQQHIDRGSMQMVKHQMIYSPERKKTIATQGHYEGLLLYYVTAEVTNLLTLLAADLPTSRQEWILLCLLSWFPHLCRVSTDSFN